MSRPFFTLLLIFFLKPNYTPVPSLLKYSKIIIIWNDISQNELVLLLHKNV